ncbi:MAG: histidine kinase [Rhodoferax sp.]
MRVLHLEDSLLDHALAVRALRSSKVAVEVVRVETIPALLSHLECAGFDAVVADYQLPGFTALDAWSAVAHLEHKPPFVLLSGAIGEQAAVQAIQLGFSDYLGKHDVQALPRVLDRAMELHQKVREKLAAEQALSHSQAQLRALAEHLHTAIEQERLSIARDIHDDIGGTLTAAKLDLHWLQRHLQGPDVLSHLDSALAGVQQALDAGKRLMLNLRPSVLEGGLVAALWWLVQGFERRTGIPVQARLPQEMGIAHGGVLITAFRTAQEALTNIAKHAQCSQVLLEASCSQDVLTLEISDNGKGCSVQERNKQGSFGLQGLAERAHAVGGWIDIGVGPSGRGLALTLTIPLNGRAAPDETDAP